MILDVVPIKQAAKFLMVLFFFNVLLQSHLVLLNLQRVLVQPAQSLLIRNHLHLRNQVSQPPLNWLQCSQILYETGKSKLYTIFRVWISQTFCKVVAILYCSSTRLPSNKSPTFHLCETCSTCMVICFVFHFQRQPAPSIQKHFAVSVHLSNILFFCFS